MEIIINKNEKIKDKYKLKYAGYDYSTHKNIIIHIDDYNYFVFNLHLGNCKMSSFENLQTCFELNQKFTLERLNELFNECNLYKLVFFVTSVEEDFYEEFSKYYKMIYNVKIPIGYGYDNQYHSCFMTGIEDYPNYTSYLKRIKKEKVKLIIS